MPFQLTVIYDDRIALPLEIEEIIGASRFSDILRRRIPLGEEIRRAVVQGGCEDFFHLLDNRDAHFLRDLIDTSPTDRIFLRLPSCLMPTLPDTLAGLIAQAAYSPGSMLLAPPMEGEAPALLTTSDILPLLHPYDPALVRELLLTPAFLAAIRPDQCGFVDLRRPSQFLAYMGGATETRLFNATRTERWTLRKMSADRQKMAAEYGFFHVAPEILKPFLLPTFDFTDDGRTAGYTMERLAIPDAALQFIHHAFDEASFTVLIERFLAFVQARPLRRDGVQAVRETARKTILGKMNDRLEQFLQQPAGQRLDALLAASGTMGSLQKMASRARILIAEAIARDPSDALAVGHGDPCFSNILFDRRTGVFRLIDPRGARHLDEAWMHPLYDLAKFSHSVLGGYDFVNNDLFDGVIDSTLCLQLNLQNGGPPSWCRTIFLDRLSQAAFTPDMLTIIRAYELSLFMSMLPLHMDHPRKLLGFALIAANLIHELESRK